MTAILYAVDPGGTTGVARGGFIDGGCVAFESSEWGSVFEAVRMIDEQCARGFVDAIACESFTPRPGVRTWQPEALYGIGALKYVALGHSVSVSLQSPADAKRFSTNEKLVHLGWRRPSTGGHADDAARHLLLLAVRMKRLDPEVLL